MNDTELDRLLRSFPVPERPEAYWRQFPDKVAHRLRPGDGGSAPARRPWSLVPFWGLGVAGACLLVGLAVGLWRPGPTSVMRNGLALHRALWREVTVLFPDSVRAIVTDDFGVRLVLSDRPDVPAADPLLIRICRGDRCESVITFSGQRVEVGGTPIEVLADAEGNVLLLGESLLWSSAEPGRRWGGLRIEARRLENVL